MFSICWGGGGAVLYGFFEGFSLPVSIVKNGH